ncbi:penicillin-binding protein [Mycolicibacterium insubricum]|uniref:Penicillin-binding protein n=1 Tax=Mycolicibacterium insubricum TaxID=444597 RepID=A0A1X0DFK7_9MYCO|nr:penicillin-binding transpeptidase domain-containing protein [Mycolicibacterium insubricum]MCB9439922.1 penicillin-binding transpeptidase domain-containing protein [Mycolicibacterium sp.]MCV7080651.1 penicillin-binding transpeptidase domain-containing protein [Mycolicibacterium insubricum]ORA70610.1 penicillin-binding protein [Mycolicibacterium insubricum]BBZ66680.1 penicillin-binding protein [Mycolicibacterium insubricum]
MVTWTSLATRVTASAAALLLTAGGLSACTPRPDGPEPAAQEFFDALTGGDTTAAAALTDRPEDARSAMNASWTGLQAERLDIATLGSKFTEDTGTVRYRFTWHLPKDRTWTYDGQLNMARDEGKWGVRWTSTDLHPRLGENQSLQLRADQPRRASVNELGGTDVLVPGYRYSYQLDARRAGRELMSTSRAIVDALRDLGGPTDPQLLAEQASSSTTPMELATLSKDDEDRVAPMLANRPGIVAIKIPDMFPTDPGFAPAVVSEVKKSVGDNLSGAPGWRVVSVNQNGVETDVLNEVAPDPAPSVSITLDRAVQNAAQNAVNGQGRKAMLVVIKPSTGDILAVAQNGAADADGPTATMGLYPPGSTFKIVTAGAAIDRNMATPNTLLGCPGEIDIGHRRIPNYDRFDLGVVPMSKAFANSCNTTFAELASRMPPRALNQTAAIFGIGRDYVVDGLPTVSGQVPPTVDLAELTEDGFGQGKVLASPFGMALAAATVAAGATPVPRLIVGHNTAVTGDAKTISPTMLDGLRAMMRMVVTNGTAKDLAGYGDVRGKTGEAEFEGGSHAWFAGYRGDMAFAALIVGGGSSEYAVRMTRQMFDSLPDGYLA